jgi:hypothetical protein
MANFTDEAFTSVRVTKDTKITKLGQNLLIVGRHRLKYLTTTRRDKDYERITNPVNLDDDDD